MVICSFILMFIKYSFSILFMFRPIKERDNKGSWPISSTGSARVYGLIIGGNKHQAQVHRH